jgi:hypothetical protein
VRSVIPSRHLEHLLTDATDHPGTTATVSTATGLAGFASLGAGAIHAAAIGVHSEHRAAVVTFTAVAVLQLAWGVLALLRSDRLVAVLGLLIGTGTLGGWVLAKVSGIPFIAGLDEAEPIQTADGLAAGLALTSVLALGAALWAWRSARPGLWAPLSPMAVGVAVLTVFGMVAAGSHTHAGDGHGADGTVAAGHHHGDETGAAHHVQDASAATVPYDPTKPIDLSGVEGVTPEQQAAAENLIAVTLHGLPQWADASYAEAHGFHSIGDGFTGMEHLVNEANMDDDVILDPDVPESLVYDTSGGGRRLVAAMYMLKRGTPLDQAPDIGGNLMQWHTHDNLCYNAEGKVRGITNASGACPAGLVKPVETPMIHVWLEPNPCGPFAALEGIAGGRIPDGEQVLCDHAHGD